MTFPSLLIVFPLLRGKGILQLWSQNGWQMWGSSSPSTHGYRPHGRKRVRLWMACTLYHESETYKTAEGCEWETLWVVS